MKTVVTRATLEHARALAAVLRPEDEAECLASGHATALEALEKGVLFSQAAYAIFFDGELGVVLGVDRALDGAPCEGLYIWCLTGKVVDRAKLSFWRVSKLIVEQMRRTFGPLHCLTDCRYTRARAWLDRLGFVRQFTVLTDNCVPFDAMTIGGLKDENQAAAAYLEAHRMEA